MLLFSCWENGLQSSAQGTLVTRKNTDTECFLLPNTVWATSYTPFNTCNGPMRSEVRRGPFWKTKHKCREVKFLITQGDKAPRWPRHQPRSVPCHAPSLNSYLTWSWAWESPLVSSFNTNPLFWDSSMGNKSFLSYKIWRLKTVIFTYLLFLTSVS